MFNKFRITKNELIMTDLFKYSPEVEAALRDSLPILALESTIISHGMPYPQNIEFVLQAESLVRSQGVIPATIAITEGRVVVGADDLTLEKLAETKTVSKVALRDIAVVLANKGIGACTVSATAHLAHAAGIRVFATGGIGGVHRNWSSSMDISQDLPALGKIPIIIVSAGVKAILDIGATLEYLETEGVCVVGYNTRDFPAFFSRKSGFMTPITVQSCKEIVNIYRANCSTNIQSAVLVANPVPAEFEIPSTEIEEYIQLAMADCSQEKITGKEVTPFLLQKIVQLSGGKSLHTNIGLALNNINLGAQIALENQMI